MRTFKNRLLPPFHQSYLTLAVKELKEQKVMASLILIAIILSSIMTTTVSCSLGILRTMRIQQAASLNGDRYATFHQITHAQRQQLENDPGLYDVGSYITVGCTDLANSGLTLFAREYIGDAQSAYSAVCKLKEGRMPDAPLEIALPENVLPYFKDDIHVGDTISLQSRISLIDGTAPEYVYAADYTVCGILESNYIGYSSGMLAAILGKGSASVLLPKDYMLYSTDFKTENTTAFQDIVDQLAASLDIPASRIQYNWILLNALGISYTGQETSGEDSGFSFIALACITIGALVLLAAGLTIINILKIAVAKQLKEYGMLRAIGCERGQIYRLVSLKLLILCAIGIPIGLLIGFLSSKWILITATGILNPDTFMAESTEKLHEMIRTANADGVAPYLVSIGITLLFAMLAAFPAAWHASHVSPIVALSGQAYLPTMLRGIKRRNQKARTIRHFTSYYAKLNLKRGGTRSIVTILSLVMSITVFVALQSFTALLDVGNDVKDMLLGDYSITNESIGIKPQSIEEILENEAVADLATTKLTTYMPEQIKNLPFTLDFSLQSWEALHVAGMNDARLASYVEHGSQQDLNDLLSGKACIIKNPIAFAYEGQSVETTNFGYGDIISVNGHRLRVVGLANGAVTINNEGFANGVQIIVNNDTYHIITGTDSYAEVYPTLKPNANATQFESWLDEWRRQNPGSHWLSYRQRDEQLTESFGQTKMLCLILILFIGLIGILNIINTVYSNIHTRIREIGIQRAIGMSAGSLYQTFLWESAYYAVIASVAGSLLGYLCTILINAATTNSLELVPFPYLPTLEAAIVSVAACLLATAIPMHAIAKIDIVPSIEAID